MTTDRDRLLAVLDYLDALPDEDGEMTAARIGGFVAGVRSLLPPEPTPEPEPPASDPVGLPLKPLFGEKVAKAPEFVPIEKKRGPRAR